jgi:hypothetical protein
MYSELLNDLENYVPKGGAVTRDEVLEIDIPRRETSSFKEKFYQEPASVASKARLQVERENQNSLAQEDERYVLRDSIKFNETIEEELAQYGSLIDSEAFRVIKYIKSEGESKKMTDEEIKKQIQIGIVDTVFQKRENRDVLPEKFVRELEKYEHLTDLQKSSKIEQIYPFIDIYLNQRKIESQSHARSLAQRALSGSGDSEVGLAAKIWAKK